MKNFLTGAARPVTDSNERFRKLFEDRPLTAPTPPERQNKGRRNFTKNTAEEREDTPPATAASEDERQDEGREGADASSASDERDEA